MAYSVVVQTSPRAWGRRADRTGRLDREVGDSIIGTMDAEGDMEQNGDKNDAGTASHYPRKHYVDSRLLGKGRAGRQWAIGFTTSRSRGRHADSFLRQPPDTYES